MVNVNFGAWKKDTPRYCYELKRAESIERNNEGDKDPVPLVIDVVCTAGLSIKSVDIWFKFGRTSQLLDALPLAAWKVESLLSTASSCRASHPSTQTNTTKSQARDPQATSYKPHTQPLAPSRPCINSSVCYASTGPSFENTPSKAGRKLSQILDLHLPMCIGNKKKWILHTVVAAREYSMSDCRFVFHRRVFEVLPGVCDYRVSMRIMA